MKNYTIETTRFNARGKKQGNTQIEQDCFLCEKTFTSEKYQSACNECEKIHEAIKPSTIKASQLAKSLGISFTQL